MAYNRVFASHHGWAIRKAVSVGLFALPSKSQLLKKLNDDGEFFSTNLSSTVSYAWSLVLVTNFGWERNLNVVNFLLITTITVTKPSFQINMESLSFNSYQLYIFCFKWWNGGLFVYLLD